MLGSDITMSFDECTPLSRDATSRPNNRWPCRCAGRRAPRCVRGARGYGLLSASCRAACFPIWARSVADLLGDRLRRLRGRGAGGGRTGDDVPGAERDSALAADGQAHYFDGRRHAARHHGRGGARYRHVRLRDAHALGPHRPGVHARRQGEYPQRRATRTIRARWTGMLLPRLHSNSAGPICTICTRPRNAGADPAHLA